MRAVSRLRAVPALALAGNTSGNDHHVCEAARGAVVIELRLFQRLHHAAQEARDRVDLRATPGVRPGVDRHAVIGRRLAESPLTPGQRNNRAPAAGLGVPPTGALAEGVLMLACERKGPVSVKQAAEGDRVAPVPGYEEAPDCCLDLCPAAGEGTRPGSDGGRGGDGRRRSWNSVLRRCRTAGSGKGPGPRLRAGSLPEAGGS